MNKGSSLIIFIVSFVVISLLKPYPTCTYPSEYTNYKSATLNQVQDFINQVSTAPMWLAHVGSSMYPTIKDGMACLCEKTDSYQKDDIITFFRVNDDTHQIDFITHRIADVTPLGYITKGDNNPKIDYLSVPAENVLCEIKQTNALQELRGGQN
jgi:signal peptidase I